MDNKSKNIDNFFKDKLGNLEAETSKNLWKRLYFLLIYKKLVLWAAFLLLLAFGIIYLFPDSDAIQASHNNDSNRMLSETQITGLSSEMQNPTDKPQQQSAQLQQDNLSVNETEANDDITPISEQKKKTTPENNKNKQKESVALPDENSGLLSNNQKEYGKAFENNLSDTKTGYMAVLNITALKTGENLPSKNIQKPFMENNYSAGDGDPNPKQKKVLWSAGLTLNPACITQKQSCECVSPEISPGSDNSSQNIFTLGASVEITASIRHLILKSGLEYAVYGQDAGYSLTTDEIDNGQSYYSYDTTWGWVYDPPEIYPYPLSIDSTFFPVYKTEEINSKNRFNYLEIPFLIGYQSGEDKKVSFEISTGCSFGFLVSASGKIPSPTDKSLLELDKSSPFIRNSSINYIAQIGVRFRLSDKTRFIIRPVYKRSLKSTYEKSFPVKQNFNTFGIYLGFDIKL